MGGSLVVLAKLEAQIDSESCERLGLDKSTFHPVVAAVGGMKPDDKRDKGPADIAWGVLVPSGAVFWFYSGKVNLRIVARNNQGAAGGRGGGDRSGRFG